MVEFDNKENQASDQLNPGKTAVSCSTLKQPIESHVSTAEHLRQQSLEWSQIGLNSIRNKSSITCFVRAAETALMARQWGEAVKALCNLAVAYSIHGRLHDGLLVSRYSLDMVRIIVGEYLRNHSGTNSMPRWITDLVLNSVKIEYRCGEFKRVLEVLQWFSSLCGVDIGVEAYFETVLVSALAWAQLNEYVQAVEFHEQAVKFAIKHHQHHKATQFKYRAKCSLAETHARFGRLKMAIELYDEARHLKYLDPRSIKHIETRLDALEKESKHVTSWASLMFRESGDYILQDQPPSPPVSMDMSSDKVFRNLSHYISQSQPSFHAIQSLGLEYSRLAHLCYESELPSKAWLYQESQLELARRQNDIKSQALAHGQMASFLIRNAARDYGIRTRVSKQRSYDDVDTIGENSEPEEPLIENAHSWKRARTPFRYLMRASQSLELQFELSVTIGDVLGMSRAVLGCIEMCNIAVDLLQTSPSPSAHVLTPTTEHRDAKFQIIDRAFKSAHVQKWIDARELFLQLAKEYLSIATGVCFKCKNFGGRNRCGHQLVNSFMTNSIWIR